MRLLDVLRPVLAAWRWPAPGAGRHPKARARLAALDLRVAPEARQQNVVAELAPPPDGESGRDLDTTTVRGRSGRDIRFDDAGRRWERVFEVPKDRRRIAQHEAVQRFAQWLREEGYDGWHSAADVLGFYRWWAQVASVEEMCPEQLWERLASAPGVVRERLRIASTTDPDMVRLRKRLERQPEGSKRRPTLYRIASEMEMELAARESATATRVRTSKTGSRSRQPARISAEPKPSRHERAAA